MKAHRQVTTQQMAEPGRMVQQKGRQLRILPLFHLYQPLLLFPGLDPPVTTPIPMIPGLLITQALPRSIGRPTSQRPAIP